MLVFFMYYDTYHDRDKQSKSWLKISAVTASQRGGQSARKGDVQVEQMLSWQVVGASFMCHLVHLALPLLGFTWLNLKITLWNRWDTSDTGEAQAGCMWSNSTSAFIYHLCNSVRIRETRTYIKQWDIDNCDTKTIPVLIFSSWSYK